jgi:glycerol-3-phosphate dehydrogenase
MKPPRHDAHVLVIGGGGTGAALAHDLTLRGLRVTLVERGELTSGTTGRHHGLLHSGGRYAVSDRESAVECIQENTVLKRICPGSFENNDGLFVAITDEDVAFLEPFLEGCEASGIPTQQLTAAQALRLEPHLNPEVKLAVRVPDATTDAMRVPMRFFATARHNGARIASFMEVVGLDLHDHTVTGALVRDLATGDEGTVAADVVVNAGGPWAGSVAALAGVDVPVQPSPGVLVAVRGRWSNMVINRLHKSSDGDIVVPQRGLSVIGTTSWIADDPDDIDVPEDHVAKMYREGSTLLPPIATAELRAAWSSARPLIGSRGASSGRELSRTFKTFDHADEGVGGFVTVTGGKGTTLRAMAEAGADLVCRKLGIDEPCRTRETVLLPHHAYYAAAA